MIGSSCGITEQSHSVVRATCTRYYVLLNDDVLGMKCYVSNERPLRTDRLARVCRKFCWCQVFASRSFRLCVDRQNVGVYVLASEVIVFAYFSLR